MTECATTAMHARHHRAPEVELHLGVRTYGARGILKDAARWKYFSLSEVGLCVWTAMDGVRTVCDIVACVLSACPDARPTGILRILAQLHSAGFTRLEGQVLPARAPVRGLRMRWVHPLEWELHMMRGDRLFGALYRRAGRFLFGRVFVVAAATLGIAGLLAFDIPKTGLLPRSPLFIAALIAAQCATSCMHECMHALAVKHFRRMIGSVGVGLFWSGLAFFVDTSDMWLGTHAERIAVSVAGPAVEFVFAGLASLLATTPWVNVSLGAALSVFSGICYYRLLICLCPLLEYDGYFVLTDLLRHPNLRRSARVWLAQWVRAHDRLQRLRGPKNRLYAAYSLASLAYVAVLVDLTANVLHWTVRESVRPFLGAPQADLVALTACIVFVALALYAVLRDFFPWQMRAVDLKHDGRRSS